MKVLLKKEVCGSREQCTEFVDSAHACETLFSNKKKEEEVKRRCMLQHYPNEGLVFT